MFGYLSVQGPMSPLLLNPGHKKGEQLGRSGLQRDAMKPVFKRRGG